MKVLIADDESTVNRMLEARLIRENYLVDFVTDVAMTLSLIRNNQYDVILLDPMFSRISGWKVITEIRNNLLNKTTPIIVVSAISSEKLITDVKASGVKDYIVKPFGLDLIVTKIKQFAKSRN
ncbi:MAG: response regulator [Daejeonella sp.]|uniref:response regulator n=1 Tax=Daejeonella sp. TaxID=2805397 RepID=UPI003C71E99E